MTIAAPQLFPLKVNWISISFSEESQEEPIIVALTLCSFTSGITYVPNKNISDPASKLPPDTLLQLLVAVLYQGRAALNALSHVSHISK